jgi:hypothetical protein
MKRHVNQNYRLYMELYAAADYAAARAALVQCIADVKKEGPNGDPAQESDFLRRIGDIFFLECDASAARRQYDLSEQADPDSLLAKYYFAQFLGEKIRDVAAAIAKCDEIVAIAQRHPRVESQDDFSTDQYAEKANQLKQVLLGQP